MIWIIRILVKGKKTDTILIVSDSCSNNNRHRNSRYNLKVFGSVQKELNLSDHLFELENGNKIIVEIEKIEKTRLLIWLNEITNFNNLLFTTKRI